MANSEPRRITRTIPATQMVALLLAFLLAAGTGGVLAAGFVIPAVAGANIAADSTVEMYDEFPAELEPQPLSQQSRIYADNGRLLATFYYQNRIVVSLDEISDHMKNAAIAIEDERFFEHHGVDVRGITRAAVNNAGGAATQGASTITQQYVKNMLIEAALQEDDPFAVIDAHEDTLNRKLREAKMAIALEKKMSKDEILQGYLNIAQYGGNQIYGVETAARYYFDKSASDLTVVEAATIAGVTKAPSQFDPTRNPENAEKRRNAVINKMWQLGYITTDERDEALDTPLEDTLDVTPVSAGCQSAKGSAFFCDYVIKEILLDPTYGETRADRNELLYRGGLEIHTTLDMKMQRQANRSVKDAVPANDPSNLEASIVTVEPGTGKILAMAQNVPYSGTTDSGRDTTVNYNADYIHGASGGFQPGSNFKPVVLAEWLRAGNTLNDTVNASQQSYTVGNFSTPCVGSLGGDVWTPRNAEGVLSGQISVLRATYESVNTAYASMGSRLNLCDLRDTAWDMGFRPTSKSRVGPLNTGTVTKDDIEIVAPMVLGTQESSPLNMAAMYATFASGGTYCTPVAITEVTGPDGEEYDVTQSECDKNALPTNIANTVVHAMERAFSDGTARRLGGLADGRPVAGKTGTSQLSAQTWFSGITPQLATTAWVGSVESPLENHTNGITVNGQYHRILYGSTVAAPMWKEYMDVAIEGMPIQRFGAPDPNLIGRAPAPPSSSSSSSGSSSSDSSSGSSDSDSSGGGGNGNGGGNGGGGNDGGDNGGGNGGGDNGGGNGGGNDGDDD
ncbi:transglycosylase domain-containing protein [Isoptericola halotolerans]|uniref:Membrane peptidoglycan carboxypeptidase n=1 Tax=Isoptericola halotolerans TaxID=300560 RepID=A0ABX2A2T3_9MICO|nr:transglycosylase domain-containing protein [Isoptericola halotolerans]NOV97165.1 membrane peptidoglycan carboxypeptidase [Isoptericola halotolerans]